MINERFNHFYFIGIGGIGMSAIARLLLERGFAVAGYDKTPSDITQSLSAAGAHISFADELQSIPEDMRSPERTLVIYTPAVPAANVIPGWFRKEQFEMVKRARALGMITADGITLAIAGTHGKTTTTTLLAHIMMTAGLDFTAILGGVSANYHTNLISRGSDYFVTEADEFDRSFLQLRPAYAAITSMDADHLDIYGEHEHMLRAYRDFAGLCTHKLLYRYGLPLASNSSAHMVSYGEGGEIRAENIRITAGSFVFDYVGETSLLNIRCGMPGLHNIENALAAISLALAIGIPATVIPKAMASFKGVKRRFEVVWQGNKGIYIDDYAHHPAEINALIRSVRMLYPGKKVLGVFQPHLFSRTRDFMDGFAESLSLLDSCWLLDIYPAREMPIEGVNSAALLEKLNTDKRMVSRDKLPTALAEADWEVLLSIGAGDIDRLVAPIKAELEKREEAA
ncbi:MAG: UDP-N-acetylmuramate--L-alanine ligase [Bacteroidia bacterium]